MKLKYLPIEDRKNIRNLRHTNDPSAIAEILNNMFKRPFTLQVLWEYKKWYYKLTEEQFKVYPSLRTAFVQLKIMEGDFEGARSEMSKLEDNSFYKIYTSLLTPGHPEEFMSIAKELGNKGYGPVPHMTLTAGRPSILSGVWDFSEFAETLVEDNDYLDETFRILFADKGEEVSELLLAQILYQRDQCYDALIKIVGLLPFLKDRKDMRLLFVALTHQIFIMVLHNQVASSTPIMENLREQITGAGLEEYTPNIDALEAWSSMYDGDYKTVTRWLREKAPDEYSKFCMLDLFRYMIKMRAYLIQGKYLAITSLAGRLLPLLESGKRYMDLCELHTIWAMSDHGRGDIKAALNHMEKALQLAQRYRFDRLIADEGLRIYEVLKLYQKTKGSTPYVERELELSKKVAMSHPHYLKSQLPEKPALTQTEMNVLRLLEAGHTNAEIARLTETTIDNAKFHCKKIFSKLEVSNRYQAVKRAIELGVLDPVEINN